MHKSEYLIVSKSVLPDYFEKVVEAREMIRSGAAKDVSEAVQKVGISRSTYYKYKDYIFAPAKGDSARKAVVSMILHHEKGILGRVLGVLGDGGANILTITQNPPISDRATVVLTMDISGVDTDVKELLNKISYIKGVERLSLIDIT
ncbi:MAG: ACT domain-containing protein [Clostridia bacterium]|nr:ACT domain-containing protein [Clostridia bacterium]